jgi:hypothetical protein
LALDHPPSIEQQFNHSMLETSHCNSKYNNMLVVVVVEKRLVNI